MEAIKSTSTKLKSALGYGKMSPNLKKAMMRLEKDRLELIESPVPNVSAAPLESNMLEWHCNIEHKGNIYHLILFFPEQYPCVSPSAEFVPPGFEYKGGAHMKGKKGTKVCLSIFSDFADIHAEWASEKNTGWSPGYTVQAVLLNVVSFLSEIDSHGGRDSYHGMCRLFVCNDCGHSGRKPYPPMVPEKVVKIVDIENDGHLETDSQQVNGCPKRSTADPLQIFLSRVVDYMSKETFSLAKPVSSNDLFGYGITLSGNPRHPFLTSPCEFLTLASFEDMISILGEAQSVHREKLNFFLPLYITDDHGSTIRGQFENTMQKMAPSLLPDVHSRSLIKIILKVIPNLMCSTVVEFSKGTIHASSNSLEGYFALHRLFLWAMDTYPDLTKAVNQQLEDFVTNSQTRRKDACPDVGQWLMLLSVTGKYTWENVAEAYLSESFNRNVMWYLKTDYKLAFMDTPMHYRLIRTFELTNVSRNLLAFQVAFLRIAKPKGMSRGDVLRRYAANLGFPTHKMVQDLKDTFTKINRDITHWVHWYSAIGVPVPSKDELNEKLKESVKFASSTKGYYFTDRRR